MTPKRLPQQPQFRVGETLEIKGISFTIQRINRSNIVLRPVKTGTQRARDIIHGLTLQDDLQRLEERVCIETQAVKEGLKAPHTSGITGIRECPKCGAVTFEADMSKVVPLESQEGLTCHNG